MLILDDVKLKLKTLAATFSGCCEAFDIEKMRGRLSELSVLQEDPDLYKDIKRAQEINSEAKYLTDELAVLETIGGELDDLNAYIDLAEAEQDEGCMPDIETSLKELRTKIDELNLSTLLKGEYDHKNAILTLHAGAGGTEAQDWTDMLFRMYRMYAEKHGFGLDVLDYLDGDEAGIKSVTFLVRGRDAYGYLKAEMGVHRLVRISPFDSNARRHTSFASLEVMPEIDNDTSVSVRPEDIKIDTYRSGGAGGQHVNKTDSAVRITHLATGVVVQCQNERSQIQNRETAMKMLLGKLVELKERENREKAAGIKGELKKIEWGSQIRSYVFQPYTMVKDHRTGYEKTDIAAVMDGGIDEFIFDYLRKS